LIKDLLDLLNEEINVKHISFERDTSKFITKTVKPNHSRLGPKYKAKAKGIVAAIEELDGSKLYEDLTNKGKVTLRVSGEEIKLTMEDFQITETEKENIAITQTEDTILLLDTALTPELEAEGFSREIVRRIQSMRKELDLDVEQRISTSVGITEEKQQMLKDWEDYIKEETRSQVVIYEDKPTGKLVKTWKIDEVKATIGIET